MSPAITSLPVHKRLLPYFIILVLIAAAGLDRYFLYVDNQRLQKQNETMRFYNKGYERIQALEKYAPPEVNKEAFAEVCYRTSFDPKVLLSLRQKENGREGLENGVGFVDDRTKKYWDNPETWNMAGSVLLTYDELQKFVWNDPYLLRRFVHERLAPRYCFNQKEDWEQQFIEHLQQNGINTILGLPSPKKNPTMRKRHGAIQNHEKAGSTNRSS